MRESDFDLLAELVATDGYEGIARQAVPAMADVLVDYLQQRER